MTMSPVMAAKNPDECCSLDGSVAAFSGMSLTCCRSKWVLAGPIPQPEAPATQQPAASLSTVKKANQVADVSAVRSPNGQIKLFAFVKSTDTPHG